MHYKNGRAAKVGDLVVGRLYNTKGLVSGTLVSVTPGSDACSALVGFVTMSDPEKPDHYGHLVKFQGTQQHGNDGPKALTYYKQDYTHCANLLHVDDLATAAAELAQLRDQK
jgi:hypothetical protein